jgi:hypothetical protein
MPATQTKSATLEDLRPLLTVRTFHALAQAQRQGAADVLAWSDADLLRVWHFGLGCLRDVRQAQAVWRQAHPLSWDEAHPLHQEP